MAEGDVLVGADGINSVGKCHIHGTVHRGHNYSKESFGCARDGEGWTLTIINRFFAVRDHLFQRPTKELLKVVPLEAIVGGVTLSGDEMKRQLALGHSAYSIINPALGFIVFVGLHRVAADGAAADFYWMIMRHDPTVGDPDHWLQHASPEEKHAHVARTVARLPPRFREIFDLTPVEGMRRRPHVWRDLELSAADVPTAGGRVLIIGDAAHAMTPFRGEGGYHTMIDAINLAETLAGLKAQGDGNGNPYDGAALETAVAAFNAEMLQRGVESVRFSRGSYEEARKTVKDRQPFAYALQQIPEKDIVLEVKV